MDLMMSNQSFDVSKIRMQVLFDRFETFLIFGVRVQAIIGFEYDFSLFLKNNSVRRASEHEVPKLVTLLDFISDLHSVNTA